MGRAEWEPIKKFYGPSGLGPIGLTGGLFGKQGGGLRPAGNLELLVAVGEVILHRLGTESEFGSDFLIGLALGDHGHDPLFLGGEGLAGGIG